MLRITPSKSASGAKEYFDESLSRGDYYSEGQEIAGSWGGRAAQSFGLEGEVTREAFHQLCENINPATGKRLTARNRSGRKVGYDFNFHCPKSVSAVYALTEDDRILEAFRASVQETMQDLERDAGCQVSGQGPFSFRPTGNMVWGEFVHFTTRPVDGLPDPHLHAHCFAFNATWDGQREMWKAAEFGGIKRDARYFEAGFHARFAGRMAQMGYPIKRDGKGFWDIDGIPSTVKEKFSRRTAEINALAEELGIVDPKVLDQLGATSRKDKAKGATTEQLRSSWDSWLTEEERAAIADAQSDADGTPQVPDITTAEALTHASQHLFERLSVVSDRQLAEAALRRGVGAVSVEDTLDRMDGLVEGGGLLRAELKGRQMVTTREVLDQEREMLDFARDGRGMCAPLGRPDYRFENPLFHDPTKDTEEQEIAIRRVLGSNDRVIFVRGGAGTGKTTLMSEVARGIEDGGHQIHAFAPTAEASRGVLRGEGFDQADTVARLLMDREVQQQVRGQVLWIDEAGLLGAQALNGVFKVAKAQGCRVILTGDKKQHNSVLRGDAARVLEEFGGVDPIEITKIQRQRVHKGPEPEEIRRYRHAIKALSEGDHAGGFERLEALGAVVEFDGLSASERYDTIARDYLEAVDGRNGKNKPNRVLAVSPTHAEGNAVSERIRDGLKAAGKLGKRDRETVRLVNLNWTEAERADLVNYRPGQVVQFHQNVKGGIKRGERFTVVGTDANDVTISGADDTTRTLPVSAAGRFSVYEKKLIPIAKGDRIRFTQNGYTSDGKHRLNNGAMYEVDGFTRQGQIKLNNGWVVDHDYGHMAHGYVTTSHASQGKTVDVVLIAQGTQSLGASSLQQFYVSASRGKEKVKVYTDDKDALKSAVGRSTYRVSATELAAGKNDEGADRQTRQMRDKRRRKYRAVMDRRERTKRRGRNHERQAMDRG